MTIHDIYFHDLTKEKQDALAFEHGYDSAEEYRAETNADVMPIATIEIYDLGEITFDAQSAKEPDDEEAQDDIATDETRAYGPHGTGFPPSRE